MCINNTIRVLSFLSNNYHLINIQKTYITKREENYCLIHDNLAQKGSKKKDR